MINFKTPLSSKLSTAYHLLMLLVLGLYSFTFIVDIYKKYVVHEYEHFSKLEFLFQFQSVLDFFPGFHDQYILHGHPGFHQFLTYLIMPIFSDSFSGLLFLNFIFFTLSLLALYKITYHLTKNSLVSFYACIAIILTPSFLIASPHYISDIPAFSFSLWAVLMTLKRRDYLAVLFYSFAVLSMESYIAFVFSTMIYFLVIKERKRTLLYTVPFLLLLLFFLVEFMATGKISNSTVTINSTLSDGLFRSWEEVRLGFVILIRHYKYLATGSLLSAIYLFYQCQKGWKELLLFWIVSIQFVGFYIFININPAIEDFFPLSVTFILTITLALHSRYKVILPVLLCLYALNFNDLYSQREAMYGQKKMLLKHLAIDLKRLGTDVCFYSKGTQKLLQYPFSGFSPLSKCFTDDWSKVTHYIQFRNLLIYPWVKGEARYVPSELNDKELQQHGLKLKIENKQSIKVLWKDIHQEIIYYKIFSSSKKGRSAKSVKMPSTPQSVM